MGQVNIEALTATLDAKHRQIEDKNESEESLLKSIHQISKETVNELKAMRKQLEEERQINSDLRRRMRKKNRQLKVLSYNKLQNDEDEEEEEKYHRKHLSLDSVDTEYSLVEDKDATTLQTFQNWCMNMGFSGKKTKCSWF